MPKEPEINYRGFSWSEFEKHADLIRRTFGIQNDPGQIPPEPEVMKKILQLSRHCVQYADFANGKPIGSAFAFPTTTELMEQFNKKEITERELFERTPVQAKYDVIYACSVMVIKSMQRKGIAKTLMTKVLKALLKEYPGTEVFYWATSEEGEALAKNMVAADRVAKP